MKWISLVLKILFLLSILVLTYVIKDRFYDSMVMCIFGFLTRQLELEIKENRV